MDEGRKGQGRAIERKRDRDGEKEQGVLQMHMCYYYQYNCKHRRTDANKPSGLVRWNARSDETILVELAKSATYLDVKNTKGKTPPSEQNARHQRTKPTSTGQQRLRNHNGTITGL